ncbi:uncharacterized protein si:dkeyp-110g5.4 isoform X2 [Neoarius graeffei]|uniref:uncharacterized protein si:dkeyp-110g5.4 isoform X2 n=1 Tax=Neoarius graeffei TaxID=443677 RepID=UPI00298BCABC|nr:uncharacterized protein si:dkeyp-110g5.4 isoform X2 [Neoarius graeffei]
MLMDEQCEDTEVFIPEQACVITVPVNSLPSSITKKISACPVQSDQPATFISPVLLREKGTTCKPRTLTSGQFFLPVVTSNRKAFKILRNFLHSGEDLLQFSDKNSRAGSTFSRRENSIILFKTQIFLIVRKAKAPDWPLEQQSSTPSECEAQPLKSPEQTHGGSDLTERRSNEGPRGAEARVTHAEARGADDRAVPRCEADDITDRKGSNDGPGAAEDHGKCAEVLKEKEADAMKDGEENKSLTPTRDVSTNTPSRYIKLEEERDVPASGEAQSSLANAQDCKGGEIQVTPRLTESSNAAVTSELGRTNETRLAAETPTGNETSSSDKHGDDQSQISKGQSSLAKTKCSDLLIFPTVQSPLLMDVNELHDKSDIKGRISESEIPLDKTETSVSVAEIVGLNNNDRVSKKIAGEPNKNVENSKSGGSIQANKGQSSHCESAVEIMDINSDDRVSNVSSDEENAVVTNVSKVEDLLEKFESLKRRINDCVHSHGSAGQFKKHKQCNDVIVETTADCDDLIIVESCVEVESIKAGSDPEVMEVKGGTTDAANRQVSDNKRHVNETSTKSKRESLKGKVASSSAEVRGCERAAVEIIDEDDNQSLHKSTNHANRDATSFKCRTETKSRACPSPLEKRYESAVEIVDLNDDDEVIVKEREIVNVRRRRVGEVCKRRLVDGFTDETSSDAEIGAQIRGGNGSSAKRPKRVDDDDDVNFSSGCKRLESAVGPNPQGKNYNRDVEIIEVDDDDDDDEIHRRANYTNKNLTSVDSCVKETKVWRNRGNVQDLSDKVSRRENDVEISDPQGRRGDGAERLSSLEKIESCCKRRVSDSNSTNEPNLDVESDAEAQIIGTEDSTVKHVKSANVTDPSGKTREESDTKSQSREAECLLEIVAECENDQVLREPNRDDTKSKNDVNETIIQILSAKGPFSEVPSSSVKNKICKTVSEVVDVHDDDRVNDANQILTNEGSCVKSRVNEVQNESAADTVDASDERERAPSDERNESDVTNDGSRVEIESYVSEAQKAAEDRGSDSDEASQDRTTGEVSGCERDAEDARVEENNSLALCSITDEPNLSVTTSESCTNPQISGDASSSMTFEHRESDSESQADPDGEFAGEQSEATNQNAHGEEVGVLPRPTPPRANHEFDYVELRREENISLIRARLRGMEEKLSSLINSHH